MTGPIADVMVVGRPDAQAGTVCRKGHRPPGPIGICLTVDVLSELYPIGVGPLKNTNMAPEATAAIVVVRPDGNESAVFRKEHGPPGVVERARRRCVDLAGTNADCRTEDTNPTRRGAAGTASGRPDGHE